ncbi:YHS domain-containing protein [Flavobacterium longum]|uniref:YHS domain-containing (seleno)protein n=1 Tax=Flavobacterium longum TaxID=1299340 RepID=UPI0039E7D693
MKLRNVFVAAVLFLSVSAIAQQAKRLAHFNVENKVGIQGYDPVAYFKQGKAVKGKKEFSASYQGIVYYFANETDKAAFLKNPTAYEPQYGGWCAFAMGDYGEKVEIDPETFKIVDGKLYLFYNKFLNNTLKSWNKNEAKLKKNADANWEKLTR